MNRTSSSTYSFSLLAVFQDEETCQDIAGLVDWLNRSVLREVERKTSWFSLAQLGGRTETREAALRAAQEAALILVSVRPDTALPQAVREWIEALARSKSDKASALVLLSHPKDGCALPPREETRHFLEDAARHGGMDFLFRESTDHGLRQRTNGHGSPVPNKHSTEVGSSPSGPRN